MTQKSSSLITGIIVLSLFLAVTYGVYIINFNSHVNETKQYLAAESEVTKEILNNKVGQLSYDVRLLSQSPFIKRLTEKLSGNTVTIAEEMEQVTSIFKHYLESHENVYQIRLISALDGNEIIRVESKNNQIVSSPTFALQNKSNRNYYLNALDKSKSDLYISPIDLNQENGKIEYPHRPTMRYVMKVYDDKSVLKSILVINYDVYNLFESIDKSLKEKSHLIIINKDGFFIFHEDFSKTYAFEHGNNTTWYNSVNTDGEIYSYKNTNDRKFIAVKNEVQLEYGENITLILIRNLSDIKELSLRTTYLSGSVFFVGVIIFFIYFVYQRRNNEQIQLISLERARISSIVNSTQEAIIGLDLNGVITDWNPSASKMYGYETNQAKGQIYQSLLECHSDHLENMLRTSDKIVKPYEAKHSTKSGSIIEVSVTPSPIKNISNELIGVSLIVRDISDDKRIMKEIALLNSMLETQVEEQSLELSAVHRLNKAIVNNAASAIISGDKTGVITMLNPAAQELLGYSAEEIVGKTTPAIFHDLEEVIEQTKFLNEKYNADIEPGFKTFVFESDLGIKNEHEWTYVTKQGERIPVLLSITALTDENGEITGYLGVATDITEIIEARKKLENVGDQLSHATQVAKLGVWTWDRAEDQYTWNKHMHDIYDVEYNQYVGFNEWFSWVDDSDRENIKRDLQNVLDGGEPCEVIFNITTSAGNAKVIQASAALQNDIYGNEYIIGINRDVTQQANHEKALKLAKQESDNANRIKSEFVANMSHEIRTPMNAIIGLMQLIQHTDLSPQQLEYISKSESAAKALLHIINDILDFSKIEAGKLTVESKPFELNDLVKSVNSIVSVTTSTKNIDFTFEVDDSIPSCISMDSLRLQQILLNLVGNAVKFTEQGFVKVKLQHLINEGQSFLKCEVMDSGLGIDESKQAMIFDAFEQAETSIVRSYGGTGLGLAITKHLVEMMNGSIEMSSQPNVGSTFTVTLPFTRSEKVIQPTQNLQQNGNAALENVAILLVEDNATNQLVASKLLKLKGADVVIANNGQHALEILEHAEQPYDLILMDLQMPVMDGFTATEQIKQTLGLNIPIIAMTANVLESDRHRSKEIGMVDHISKPFKVDELVNTILKHLK